MKNNKTAGSLLTSRNAFLMGNVSSRESHGEALISLGEAEEDSEDILVVGSDGDIWRMHGSQAK